MNLYFFTFIRPSSSSIFRFYYFYFKYNGLLDIIESILPLNKKLSLLLPPLKRHIHTYNHVPCIYVRPSKDEKKSGRKKMKMALLYDDTTTNRIESNSIKYNWIKSKVHFSIYRSTDRPYWVPFSVFSPIPYSPSPLSFKIK